MRWRVDGQIAPLPGQSVANTRLLSRSVDSEAGALTATQRANGIWKQILADFEAPALDPARAEALQAFIDRRSAEGGAPVL